MEIERREVTVSELVKGYNDDGEGGVIGLWRPIGHSSSVSA